MFLGIEIGGTKLQLGVGDGERAKLESLVRCDIEANRGAERIREQIFEAASQLSDEFDIQGIGIGFGGPVDSANGIITKSHQVKGWDRFPMTEWLDGTFNCPTALGNDCDVAAIAEHRYGAGQGKRSIYYVTIGTGIGGGLIIDNQPVGEGRPSIAEIGHLRPGPLADHDDVTVESFASGWGIRDVAIELMRLSGQPIGEVRRSSAWRATLASLVEQFEIDCGRDQWQEAAHALAASLCGAELDAQKLSDLAVQGNSFAQTSIRMSIKILGWAIAQVATIVSPEAFVIGGGVALMPDDLFLAPLRTEVAQYLFAPLESQFEILPASLGEEVVVHGAISLAAIAKRRHGR